MNKRTILVALVVALIAVTLLVGVYFNSLQGGTTLLTSSISTRTQPLSSSTTGTLAILVTDTSTIPQNVTAFYISFSDLQLHISNAGNLSGWTDLGPGGEINLISVANSTETIYSANLSSGSFDAVRLNTTSSAVSYQGQNYSANQLSDEEYLTVPIQGGLNVTGGQVSGAIVQMTPTLLSLGNSTNPSFGFLPAAKGHVLPSFGISNHPRQGDRSDYSGSLKSIFRDLTHFQLDSAVVNTTLLTATVQNTGSDRIALKIISLTSGSSTGGAWAPSSSFGSVAKISEFFVILANGSLFPLTTNSNKVLLHDLTLKSYTLAPYQTVTFTYIGPITLGSLKLLEDHAPTQQLTMGQSCVMTILGSGKYVQIPITVGAAGTFTNTSTA